MKYRRQKVICGVMLFIFLLPSGCSLKYSPGSAEEFEQETLRLEKRARAHKEPAARAEAQLELAWFYLHHRNPQLNYGKALQEFEVYLSATAVDRQNDEIQNWLHALREMERQERETARLKESLADLTKETARLKDSIAGLTQENEESRNSLVLELRKNQELQTALDQFQSQLETLEWTTRNLREANEKMKQTVEKLKNLDFQMEDKRKAIQ